MSSSREEFVSEAEEILNEAQEYLLQLQETISDPSPDALNGLFRCFHTLKGISGLFGFDGLQKLSHSLEDLLDDIRLGRFPVTVNTINFIFKFIDTITNMIKNVKEKDTIDVTSLINEVENFRRTPDESDQQESPLSELVDPEILRVLSEYEEHRLKENIKKKRSIYLIEVIYPLTEFDSQLRELTEKVKELGELISTLPTSEGIPEGSIGFKLLLASDKGSDFIKEATGCNVEEIVPGEDKSPPPVKSEEKTDEKPASSLKSASSTVRVDIEKLDRILNTIGEISLVKGAIKRIEDELIDYFGHSSLIFDIHRINQTLERRLTELQDYVLEIRMVPIGQIFSRLGQIIRRYSREIGKPIELRVFGEDTEIDKFIAEEIVDPLMHIVRNALDHGIETPEERLSMGKPETATITLKAFQKGNHVVVEVHDDGRGIDINKIREKAIEKCIIDKDTEIEDSELIELIFRPGFSTKDSVTEVSGRGVGMDVVREKLSSIGGFVDVKTETGKFTTFSLTIPITLAIIKALLIKVGSHTFALPLTSISETILIKRDEIQSIEGKPVYNLRDDPLPLMPLSEFYRLEVSEKDVIYIVVAGVGERKIGLIVDDVLKGEDIVIKSLGGYFENLKGFAGAAEVGKHEVVLVVDVEAIIEETLKRHKKATMSNV